MINISERITDEKCKFLIEQKGMIFHKTYLIPRKDKGTRRIVEFSCKIHENLGVQEIVYERILSSKCICGYCNGKKLKSIFKEKLFEIDPNIELLSEYQNSNIKVKCRCKIHKEEWEAYPLSLLNHNIGCKSCNRTKSWDTRGRISTEEFLEKISNVNNNIDIIGDYTGYHNKIKCKCKFDGYEWESTPSHLLMNDSHCPKCAKKKMHDVQAMTQEEFESRIDKLYNGKYQIISKYYNKSTPVSVKCKEHDLNFDVLASSLLYKNCNGCAMCTISKGERKIISILQDMGHKYETQYTFDDCVNINKLRFDVYDYFTDTLYEYQGIQHYEPIDFSGKGQEDALNRFKKLQINDKIKYDYCKNNNKRLIRIPYWDYEQIDKYIV